MMRAVIKCSGADATLVYVGRSESEMPFVGDLREAFPDRVRVIATERDGRPDLSELAGRLTRDTSVYCCGRSTAPAIQLPPVVVKECAEAATSGSSAGHPSTATTSAHHPGICTRACPAPSPHDSSSISDPLMEFKLQRSDRRVAHGAPGAGA
jgi:hypothetical protein